ncbi:MAG: TonB-dependent receptor domain-containing protein [Spirosomataceae bacterium]
MKLRFTLLFLISSLWANGQDLCSVKGKLLDSLTKEPLAYASIRLEPQSDKSKAKGDVANEKGEFQFNRLSTDTFKIRVDYVGYQTKWIEVKTDKSTTEIEIGAILLVPSSQFLEAVTVTGLKSAMVASLEKQVFQSDQFEVAKGGTATDILRNIPSVSVNAEGEISVRGSKGFLILINGKPTQLDATTILAQIPANTIEKIEMITAPSAKYDADGKAGIINIVTKKGAYKGFSVTSNLQYGLPRLVKEYPNAEEPDRYGADFSLLYHSDKWDIATSVNYLKNDIAGRREGDVNTLRNGVRTSFPSEGERSLKRENYGVRIAVNRTLNTSNEISAGAYFGRRDQFRLADILYENTKTGISTGEVINRTTYFNSNLVRKSGIFKVANLDYTHRFSTSSNITVSGLYEDALVDGFTQNRNLNTLNYADTLQYTLNTGRNPLQAIRFKVDYEKKWGIGTLTSGYQFRNQEQKGKFAYFEKEGNLTNLTLNPAFSANVDIRQRIHSIYTQYAGKVEKYEFLVGMRYENAFRALKDSQNEEPFLLKLSNLFPSLTVRHDWNETMQLKLAYSRRVQRSTNNELNPYPEREHSETLEQGDPLIRPEFIGIYEAGITKNYKKISLYWNIYRQQITDIVNRVNSVYNDTILNRIYTNAGKARLLGSEFGVTVAPHSKWKLFMGGNLYNLQIRGSLFSNSLPVNSSGWVYSVNSNVNYQMSKSFSFQGNIAYLSARNTAQGIDSRFYQPNFSVKKTWLDARLALSIQWQNAAFKGMKVNEQRITTEGVDFFTTTNYIQERNIILFNISYNVNQSDRKRKVPASEFGEREF